MICDDVSCRVSYERSLIPAVPSLVGWLLMMTSTVVTSVDLFRLPAEKEVDVLVEHFTKIYYNEAS